MNSVIDFIVGSIWVVTAISKVYELFSFPADLRFHPPFPTMPILDPVAIARIGAFYGNFPPFSPLFSPFCDDKNNPCQLTISDELICQTSLILSFFAFLFFTSPSLDQRNRFHLRRPRRIRCPRSPKIRHRPKTNPRTLPPPPALPLRSAADG